MFLWEGRERNFFLKSKAHFNEQYSLHCTPRNPQHKRKTDLYDQLILVAFFIPQQRHP